MRLRAPGFTADASDYQTRSMHSATTAQPPQRNGRVVAQQWEQCRNSDGTCTSIWPGYRGTQCVTGLSGYQQCCNAAGTWPHIRECPSPGGGWQVTEAGCWGPCL